MKQFGWIILIVTALASCKATESVNELPKMIYTDIASQDTGGLRGIVVEPEGGEGLPFATVKVMRGEEIVAGTTTDFDGGFEINGIDPGQYDVKVEYIGYQPPLFQNVIIKAGKMLEVEGEIRIEMIEIIELKPIIYLYPEETIEVEVELVYDGELTHSYPKTTTSSWKVQAFSDGTLTDASGREYYGLFWEGKPNKPIQPNCGSVVEKDSLIPFLEASLDQLGLSHRESNEFIVFWLPILEQASYNLIYFASEDYTNHAQLNISPEPDNLIRVMMGYVPLESPVSVLPQILPEQPKREGFTVVEWGGTRCFLPSL